MDSDQAIFVESDEDKMKGNDKENEVLDPFVGMTVRSVDEAYEVYNAYAVRLGFSVRTGKKRYNKDNKLRQSNYVCSKEGFREDFDPSKERKYAKLDSRTGCKAGIRFTVDNGLLKVTYFNPEHNHELVKGKERRFLRSGRKVSDAHKGILKTKADVGIRTTKAYSYMAKEFGGMENVGFTKRDCYNFLSTQSLQMIEAGDAQSLINHFREQQDGDPMFFYAIQVDQENRMTNFFWRDGRSRLDYDCFGDVVMFDTTYRTDKYNMICAPFVGINHHWKNVLFGCAFLLDETTVSFMWLFETFLKSMGGRQPRTIFTDQCQAMANAIEVMLPETRHQLCLRHISKNATQHLASYYGNPEFEERFNKCLYSCASEVEFENTWNHMVMKFGLEENKWLKQLYGFRVKWCPAFSLDTFSARITSSQWNESTNNVFHQMSTKTMNLTEFVGHYVATAEQMREVELEEDFRCGQGAPPRSARGGGILMQAAHVYTHTMFKVFENEFISSLAVLVRKECNSGSLHFFELIEQGNTKVYNVSFDSLCDTISCDCKMFESMGILCRHALRVLNVKNVTEIPSQYVMLRWTKDARKRMVVYNSRETSSTMDEKMAKALRRNELMRETYNVMSLSAETISGTQIARQKISELAALVHKI